jgi:hypothetical protein
MTLSMLEKVREAKRFYIALLSALMLIAMAPAPAHGAVEQNIRIPLVGGGFAGLPCIDEDIAHTDGYLHVKISLTENVNRVSGSAHFQPQGAKLVGLASGDEYVGTGMSRDSFNEPTDSSGATTVTLVSNFKIFGKRKAPNLLAQQVVQITIAANGEMTAEVHSESVECR